MLFLSDELKTLDFTIRVDGTPTLLYFDLHYILQCLSA